MGFDSGEDGDEIEQEEVKYALVIQYDDLDLTTAEGQETLVIRIERVVLDNASRLSALDLKIINTIKDMVKLKKEMDTLKIYIELRDRIKKLEEKGVSEIA